MTTSTTARPILEYKTRVYVFQTTIGWNTGNELEDHFGGRQGEEEVAQRAETLRDAVDKIIDRLEKSNAWLVSIQAVECRGRVRKFRNWDFSK